MASAFTIEGAGFGRSQRRKRRKSDDKPLAEGHCKRVPHGETGHTIETCRLRNRNGRPVLKFTKGSVR